MSWQLAPRREAQVAAAVLAVAVLAALLVPTYPNYDSYFALTWGRELLHGQSPGFQAYAAPTEHPLWLAWCALLDLVFGGVADRALVVADVAAFVALVWAVLRTGRACFGPLAGLVAALCCGSSFAFLLYAARGYVDVPFLALVLWAAALEAERPRRGRSVLVVLAVAGLLRPEAWILGGAYWLWLAPRPARVETSGGQGTSRFHSTTSVARALLAAARQSPGLLALAVAAPVFWFALDAAVTGDPLFSLHSTSALADALGRERGLRHVPTSFVSFLAATARPPVFAAGLLGLWLAWRRRSELNALHVPYALFGAGLLTFVGTGVAGLSILPRYLTVPAVALCLFAGYVVGGFERLPAGRLREWWTRGAYGAVLVGVAFLVVKLGSFRALATELRFIHSTHVAVVDTADDQSICRPLTLPTYRLVPDLRFELGGPDAPVVARSAPTRPHGGAALYVVGRKPISRFGHADGVSRRTNDLPQGPQLARHGMLAVYGC